MRITFVTPHQRPTSGGVYTIHLYAELLAERHDVMIAVRRGELRDVPGCSVVRLEEAGTCNVVVYPADNASDDLPGGIPVCYLQGFGTPGNPTVLRNLGRAHHVIASAHWLADEARRHGCPTDHVPYGLDRALFHPGVPAEERGRSLLMMTHTIDWKGTDEGMAAVSRVRSKIPSRSSCSER